MGPGTDTERPLFRKPDLGEGRDVATPARSDRPLLRKNTLDDMTVGRTEKSVAGHAAEEQSNDKLRQSNPTNQQQACTHQTIMLHGMTIISSG